MLHDRDEREANARLIARAPDLLAFVVETMECARLGRANRGKFSDTELDDLYDLLEATENDAVDLIAKIEAEAS